MNENCRTTLVEVFGTRFPWQVESFNMNQDSSSAGKFRGSFGAEKVLKCNANLITISQILDRHHIVPCGLFEGQGILY
ncbi:hydantoinase B/oxoprolinase family protein [Siminovitchia fortis]|uniref:hydantoinase B/oxoprolinase family protein n=1 Tax=Siminovitchia fortis TaxID=254758 RepID=UPI0011A78A87|nr:hydantoinase B/oxoprolinase family protein [Siminovitchia fortis]